MTLMKKVTFLNLSIHKGEFMFFDTDFLKSEQYILDEREKSIYKINFK